MIRSYIQAAMQHARYEMIDQPGEPFYGEIPLLQGGMAIGKTLEQCRRNLEDALDSWLLIGLRSAHEIPEVEGINLKRIKVEGLES